MAKVAPIPTGNNPTQMIAAQFKRARDYRVSQGIDAAWQKYEKAYDGEETLPTRRGSEETRRQAKAYTNLIFSNLETIKAVLSQSVPVITLSPVMRTEAWTTIAEIYQKSFERILARNIARTLYAELIHDGLIAGKSYIKSVWDPEMGGGNGDVRLSVPHYKSVYMEPGKNYAIESNMIFEARSVDLLTLVRTYPEKRAEIIKLSKEASRKGERAKLGFLREKLRGFSATAPGAAASTETSSFFEVMDATSGVIQNDIELIEAWFWDEEMVERDLPVIDPESMSYKRDKMGKVVKKPQNVNRYPNGRLMQFSGKLLFNDQPNEFPGLPYAEYLNYISRKQYGVSEVANILNIQKQYNIRNRQLFDLMRNKLDRTMFLGAATGLDAKEVTNQPNGVYNCNTVREILVVDSPRVGTSEFDSMEKLERQLEGTTGVREVTQGTIPGDIRSGAAIEALQEAADVRLRGKSAQIEACTDRLVRFLIPLISANYVEGIHYVLDEDDVTREKLKKTDEWKIFDSGKAHADLFDITIEAGVNRPRSRIAQEARQQWFFDKAMLDEEYMITHSQIEDKDDVIERNKDLWELKRLAAKLELEAKIAQLQQGGVESGSPNSV